MLSSQHDTNTYRSTNIFNTANTNYNTLSYNDEEKIRIKPKHKGILLFDNSRTLSKLNKNKSTTTTKLKTVDKLSNTKKSLVTNLYLNLNPYNQIRSKEILPKININSNTIFHHPLTTTSKQVTSNKKYNIKDIILDSDQKCFFINENKKKRISQEIDNIIRNKERNMKLDVMIKKDNICPYTTLNTRFNTIYNQSNDKSTMLKTTSDKLPQTEINNIIIDYIDRLVVILTSKNIELGKKSIVNLILKEFKLLENKINSIKNKLITLKHFTLKDGTPLIKSVFNIKKTINLNEVNEKNIMNNQLKNKDRISLLENKLKIIEMLNLHEFINDDDLKDLTKKEIQDHIFSLFKKNDILNYELNTELVINSTDDNTHRSNAYDNNELIHENNENIIEKTIKLIKTQLVNELNELKSVDVSNMNKTQIKQKTNKNNKKNKQSIIEVKSKELENIIDSLLTEEKFKLNNLDCKQQLKIRNGMTSWLNQEFNKLDQSIVNLVSPRKGRNINQLGEKNIILKQKQEANNHLLQNMQNASKKAFDEINFDAEKIFHKILNDNEVTQAKIKKRSNSFKQEYLKDSNQLNKVISSYFDNEESKLDNIGINYHTQININIIKRKSVNVIVPNNLRNNNEFDEVIKRSLSFSHLPNRIIIGSINIDNILNTDNKFISKQISRFLLKNIPSTIMIKQDKKEFITNLLNKQNQDNLNLKEINFENLVLHQKKQSSKENNIQEINTIKQTLKDIIKEKKETNIITEDRKSIVLKENVNINNILTELGNSDKSHNQGYNTTIKKKISIFNSPSPIKKLTRNSSIKKAKQSTGKVKKISEEKVVKKKESKTSNLIGLHKLESIKSSDEDDDEIKDLIEDEKVTIISRKDTFNEMTTPEIIKNTKEEKERVYSRSPNRKTTRKITIKRTATFKDNLYEGSEEDTSTNNLNLLKHRKSTLKTINNLQNSDNSQKDKESNLVTDNKEIKLDPRLLLSPLKRRRSSIIGKKRKSAIDNEIKGNINSLLKKYNDKSDLKKRNDSIYENKQKYKLLVKSERGKNNEDKKTADLRKSMYIAPDVELTDNLTLENKNDMLEKQEKNKLIFQKLDAIHAYTKSAPMNIEDELIYDEYKLNELVNQVMRIKDNSNLINNLKFKAYFDVDKFIEDANIRDGNEVKEFYDAKKNIKNVEARLDYYSHMNDYDKEMYYISRSRKNKDVRVIDKEIKVKINKF